MTDTGADAALVQDAVAAANARDEAGLLALARNVAATGHIDCSTALRIVMVWALDPFREALLLQPQHSRIGDSPVDVQMATLTPRSYASVSALIWAAQRSSDSAPSLMLASIEQELQHTLDALVEQLVGDTASAGVLHAVAHLWRRYVDWVCFVHGLFARLDVDYVPTSRAAARGTRKEPTVMSRALRLVADRLPVTEVAAALVAAVAVERQGTVGQSQSTPHVCRAVMQALAATCDTALRRSDLSGRADLETWAWSAGAVDGDDRFRSLVAEPLEATAATYYRAAWPTWGAGAPLAAGITAAIEAERGRYYVHPTVTPSLLGVIDALVITPALPQLVTASLADGIMTAAAQSSSDGHGNVGDGAHIARVYALVARVGAQTSLAASLAVSVKGAIAAVLNHLPASTAASAVRAAAAASVVRALLRVKAAITLIVTVHCHGDKVVAGAAREALERSCSQPAVLQATANYVDLVLRGRLPGAAVTPDIEALLDDAVDVFALLSDKDVFLDIARTLMASRLLGGKVDVDNERALIVRLKTACGAHFTSRLEGMLADAIASSSYNVHFADYLRTATRYGVDTEGSLPAVDFTVLTTVWWPPLPLYDTIELPPSIVKQQVRAPKPGRGLRVNGLPRVSRIMINSKRRRGHQRHTLCTRFVQCIATPPITT